MKIRTKQISLTCRKTLITKQTVVLAVFGIMIVDASVRFLPSRPEDAVTDRTAATATTGGQSVNLYPYSLVIKN